MNYVLKSCNTQILLLKIKSVFIKDKSLPNTYFGDYKNQNRILKPLQPNGYKL